jgi:hypothetical protein
MMPYLVEEEEEEEKEEGRRTDSHLYAMEDLRIQPRWDV